MTNIYSPNMIKTYLNCPKKFCYQYIEHLNIPKLFSRFEKGKKIHALANYKLQGIEISRIETALSDEELQLWNLLQNNPFFVKDCLKTEFTLSVALKNGNEKYWLGGRIDAIVHDGNEYYILDYKTGNIPNEPEFDPQTMIYLLCTDRFLKKYDKLSFVYINLKDRNNYVIEFNQDLKKQYEGILFEICQKITANNTFSENNNQCKYCEYKGICG